MSRRLRWLSPRARSPFSGAEYRFVPLCCSENCKPGAPLYPEDKVPATSAGVAQDASDEYYTPKTADRAAQRIAPTARPLFYSRRPPYQSEFHRLDL